MKKQSILLAMLAFGLAFTGCVNETPNSAARGEGEPLVDQQFIDDGGSFDAKVLEIRESFVDDNYVLVEPLEGEAIRGIADRISFVGRFFSYTGISVGDYITIRYDGFVMKSYPAQIVATGWSLLQTNPGTGGGDPVPTHWYGCAFSVSANTSPRNGTHFLLSIPYADAFEKITQVLGTNDGTAVNPNLTSRLMVNKTNWVIIEEEVINASLFHVRLIQDVNGERSGVYWNYNPSAPR
ncbi:MAG: hypothetical protein LBQ94_07105 [Treponema sp.]|jgi:hypothetical protein|nr:hypothetical protein [Treponema sp.]